MKTLFIPLDERPCNYNFPLMIAQSNQQIELVEPDKSFLGHKKKPAVMVTRVSFPEFSLWKICHSFQTDVRLISS